MLEALWTGLGLVFQWPAIGFLGLGCVLGIWIGAVPGLGGIIGLVLLLPFIFGMEPVAALALLLVSKHLASVRSMSLGPHPAPGSVNAHAALKAGLACIRANQSATPGLRDGSMCSPRSLATSRSTNGTMAMSASE